MNELDLVVACHCEQHPQMHIKKTDNTIEPLSNKVTYVDPQCRDKTWESIPSLSKKYVWGENCSVYMELRLGARTLRRGGDPQLLNILRESYRILKAGGIVMFPFENWFYSEESIETLKNAPEIKSQYTISIIEAKDAPFILGHLARTTRNWTFPDENVIIFTKRATMGGLNRKKKRCVTRKKRAIR